MTLILRHSRIHSYGCYTTRPIRKGTLIVEYVGEYLTYEQADDLYDKAWTAASGSSTDTAWLPSSIIPANQTARPIRYGARCGLSRCAILRPEKS